jgi:Domain of unknown function (DUF4192)
MTTTIHLSGPDDMLAVLPYQLGFHPQDCLVAVSLLGPRSTRMGLVQRLDLPLSEHLGDAVAAMMRPLMQDLPAAVQLVGYEEREGDSRAMLDAMAGACRARGIRVPDRLVVRGGRWFDLDCARSCCPSGGLPLPDPSSVPAVAEFVGREICPLPDRSALAGLLEPIKPLRSRAVSLLADEWLELRMQATDGDLAESELPGFRASELAVWARVLCDEDDAEPVGALPPQDLAILAASLTDVALRDGLIAWLCPGTLSPDVIDPSLIVQMSRALPETSWLGQHAAALRDGVVGEAARKIGAVGDASGRGPAARDGSVRDAAVRDAAVRDAAVRDAAVRDAAVRDAAVRDAAVRDAAVRDAGASEVTQVIGRQRIERRLCELSAALPDPWAVSTLTVLASFTWWRGDGALTRIALDRALRVDPDYRLARLLEQMVDLAIRPERASA